MNTEYFELDPAIQSRHVFPFMIMDFCLMFLLEYIDAMGIKENCLKMESKNNSSQLFQYDLVFSF